MSYVLPQVQVFQEFSQLPSTVVANLNAFVFGPNYKLFRCSVAAEKALIGLGVYDPDNDTEYDYPGQPAGSSVDLSYVSLCMDNLWAEYAELPASATAPVVCMSHIERNKLRAAPRIFCQSRYKGRNTVGVTFEDNTVGGFYTGGASLPESYYFYPVDTGDLEADDVTVDWVTSASGYVGSLELLATDTPLTAGVYSQFGDGIVCKLSDGTGRSISKLTWTAATALVGASGASIVIDGTTLTEGVDLTAASGTALMEQIKEAYEAAVGTGSEAVAYIELHPTSATAGVMWVIKDAAPAGTLVSLAGWVTTPPTLSVDTAAFPGMVRMQTFTFVGSSGATLTFTLKPTAIANLVDDDADNNVQFHVNINDLGTGGSGGISGYSVTYTEATQSLDIQWDSTTLTTLGEIRAAILGDGTVGDWFSATVLDDDESLETIASVEDATGPLGDAYDLYMLRDAYRVNVDPNPYTFATGNGESNSAHFKTRGVCVGDKVRYSVVGNDTVTYEGTTYITGIEADPTAAMLGEPTAATDNALTQTANSLQNNQVVAGVNDIVVAGAENRRDFDGPLTALYALDSDVEKYPGELSKGLLGDTYTVQITVAGTAGTAQATVSSDGGYYRENVPIHEDPVANGAIYIGNNLWIRFDQGTGDADAEFQLGDTYTFSADVEAAFNTVPAEDLTVSGKYRGPRDTTYVIEVVRGGVFVRDTAVLDGLQSANKYVVATAINTVAGDAITIDTITFTASAAPATTTEFLVGGTQAETMQNLAAAINAYDVRAWATLELAGLTIVSEAAIIGAITDDLNNGVTAGTASTAALSISLSWQGGDVDDEYVLKCTQAGPLATAVFELSSVNGDLVSGLQFADGVAQEITSQGLTATVTLGGGAAPQFTVGDYWVIKVYGCRPQVRIYDTAGVDDAAYTTVVAGTPIALGGYGGYVTFDTNRNLHGGLAANSDGGLLKGDVFYVAAEAAGSGAYKVLVLADDLPAAVTCGREVGDLTDVDVDNDWTANYNPTEFTVWLYLVQANAVIPSKKVQSPPDYNWEAAAGNVTVNSGIAVQDSSWVNGDGSQDYLPVYRGDMYLAYRALLTDYADGIYSINDIGDVVSALGTVHPDNPLAQGVYNALANSGEQPVYFMAVPTDNLAGYSTVFDRASLVDTVYGLVPLTTNAQVVAALEAHVDEMSSAENKRWRIGFVAADTPTSVAVMNAATNAGTDWTATVTDNPAVPAVQYTLVTVTNGTPTLLTTVAVGDKVRVRYTTDAWGTASYEEYTVAQVLTNSTLLLSSGPAVAVGVAAKIEIWHDNSNAEVAAAVKAQSEAFGNRRLYRVFPNALYQDGVLETGVFGAAAIAGLTSSVPPQQGLTNIEVTGFDDIPAVYRTYSRSQLNTMAEGGTLILMQDQAGGRIYVRHQVSTATVDGNLLTQELSITKNLDAISYYFAAVLEPFYGRYNITPELLDVIETQVQNGLNFLGSDQVSVGLLGPMVILENDYTKIRSIEQHPTLRDQILITVDLELPLPANVVQLKLVVGDVSTSATIGG